MCAMAIMTRDTWISDTKRAFHSRTQLLQDVDTALYNYGHDKSKENLRKLKTAFEAWTSSKTKGGIDSIRNKKNAVAHLRDQIDDAILAGGLGRVPVDLSAVVLRPHRVAPSTTATRTTMTDDGQVTAFTNAVKLLWTAPSWNGKTKQERGAAMIAAVSSVHTACGIPNVTPDIKTLPPGYNGFFQFSDWSIQLSQELFDFAFNPGNRPQLVDLAETVYHESRHCEQWFHMARYYGLGRTSVDIGTNLGIGPSAVCDEAKRRQMTSDDKMNTLTEAWFRSVYGDSDREITLKTLGLNRQAATVDMTNFHDRVHQSYSGGLPEEVDAWAIQLLVRAKF